jgi:DNA-binding IscR family transcriptional regulator
MHKQYRNRLIYGAQYRADIVTATQLGLTRVKDIVRLIGVSQEPASRILADLRDAGILQSRTLPAMSHEGYLEDSHTLRPDR